MATKEELHVGDIGTSFELTIRKAHDNKPLDISGATVKRILFQQPDGTIETKTASFVTNGRDGKIKYVTESGDIDQVGQLQYRAEVTLSSAHYESSTKTVTVHNRWTA